LGWEKIGFVQGNGNSNSPKNYAFTDKNPAGGSKFIYRLKQIDNDGKFEYSDQVEVELLPDKFELYQNYPNPFNPVTNIKFSLPADSKLELDIYNIIGEHLVTLVNKIWKLDFTVFLLMRQIFPAEHIFTGLLQKVFLKLKRCC
jgi:hypothetical protein